MEFHTHYRMGFVHLHDVDCNLQLRHNGRVSWPFKMLVDPNGEIVWVNNGLIEDEQQELNHPELQ